MSFTGQKPYQEELQLATVYEIKRSIKQKGSEQIQPTLEVIGGSVNVYGSQVEPTSAPAGMYLTKLAYAGIDTFASIPNYLYIEQNTGTTTKIVISVVEITEVS